MTLSCQREVSVIVDTPAPPDTPGTLDDLLKANRSRMETFTRTDISAAPVITAKGTKIFFSSNALMDENNKPVTGAVKISVKEITTPGEMILNDMPTVSGNRLLESGGEYNITISQDNKQLHLAPGNYIKINLPETTAPANGMQVFNGVTNTDGSVNWVPNNTPGNFVVRDSGFLRMNLVCDNINWINCDQFVNEPLVEFSVYPGNTPLPDSTNVFIHLTGRNTVVKMNWTQGLSYFNSKMVLPVASTIIGISKKDGQLFASFIPVIIKNGQSVSLDLAAYTEEQLKKRMALLK